MDGVLTARGSPEFGDIDRLELEAGYGDGSVELTAVNVPEDMFESSQLVESPVIVLAEEPRSYARYPVRSRKVIFMVNAGE